MALLPLICRFLLDAQDEFVRTLDHVPNPGRGGPWGKLNASGWVAAHLAFSQDNWINVLAAGGEHTPWVADWSARQREATLAHPIETAFDEARAAFADVAAITARNLEGWDAAALDAPITTVRGTVKRGYLVARACAHAFVHMGELSVIASLAGAGDARLPGGLAHTRETAEEHDAGLPVIARLLLDGYDEVARVTPVLSAPALMGAFERLNPGTFTVAHIAEHEDRVWNVSAQGRPRDAWMESAHVSTGDPRSAPAFDEALAAAMRVRATAQPYIESLRAADLGTILDVRGGSALGTELARSVAHCFVHAGELMAVASLFGAADLGQPGMLAHVAEA